MAKSSADPSITETSTNLPTYTDRLPSLLEALEETARRMQNLPEIASYLPNWEPLYDFTHSLKGLAKIIECSEAQQKTIIELSNCFGKIAIGSHAIRNGPAAAEVLLKIRTGLEGDQDIEAELEKLLGVCEIEFEHEDRMKEIPHPISNLTDFASKRAYEIKKFGLSSKAYSEIIYLEEFSNWHHKLETAVRGNHKDRRGLLVACLPQFENTREKDMICAWAWVSPGRPGDESVFQRTAAAIPEAFASNVTD